MRVEVSTCTKIHGGFSLILTIFVPLVWSAKCIVFLSDGEWLLVLPERNHLSLSAGGRNVSSRPLL